MLDFVQLILISRLHLWSSARVIFGFFFTSLSPVPPNLQKCEQSKAINIQMQTVVLRIPAVLIQYKTKFLELDCLQMTHH